MRRVDGCDLAIDNRTGQSHYSFKSRKPPRATRPRAGFIWAIPNMPTMPPTFRPPRARSKQERDRDHDVRRRVEKPWRRWYQLPAWKEIRAGQLAAEPYCRRCRKRGSLVKANTVNHVEPHRGDWAKFIAGPFESVCATCHNAEVQREERRADAMKAKDRCPF